MINLRILPILASVIFAGFASSTPVKAVVASMHLTSNTECNGAFPFHTVSAFNSAQPTSEPRSRNLRSGATSKATADPRGSAAQESSVDLELDHRQIVWSVQKGIGFTAEGQWDWHTGDRGVEFYYPIGSDAHSFLFVANGEIVDEIEIGSGGEVIACPSGLLILNVNHWGGVKLVEHLGSEKDRRALFDDVFGGVEKVIYTGGCWGPTAFNPTTGAYSKKCNKNNGMPCDVTITFKSGSSDEMRSYTCDETLAGTTAGNASECSWSGQ